MKHVAYQEPTMSTQMTDNGGVRKPFQVSLIKKKFPGDKKWFFVLLAFCHFTIENRRVGKCFRLKPKRGHFRLEFDWKLRLELKGNFCVEVGV
jgi:hypothetical protein